MCWLLGVHRRPCRLSVLLIIFQFSEGLLRAGGFQYDDDRWGVAVTQRPATMVLEDIARKLSIPELFHFLDEKLGEECSKPLSVALSAVSIESEVHSSSLGRRTTGIVESDDTV